MLRAIVIATLSVGAIAAQVSPTGLATCACLSEMPESTERVDCSYDWAVNGKCFETQGLTSNFTTYPGDYGLSCKVHDEPGHSACTDLTTVPPTIKAPTNQAKWCNDKWCYIDPCNCDASDATKSDYFPGTMFYSYATCGDRNSYTAIESAVNSVGNAECATASEDSDDACSFTMGLGSVLVVTFTMMA